MPYLTFDLNAMARAENAARAAGVPDTTVKGGLLNLWAHCFRENTDRVVIPQVVAFFGVLPIVEPLVAFGFLERDGDAFRVKGADRYLRITAARKLGGEKSKGNLKKGTKKPGASRDTSPAPPRLPPGSAPALSASSEQRTAITEKLPFAGKPAKVDSPPDPRHQPLVDALCLVFEAKRGAKYGFTSRDGKAVKELLTKAEPPEIQRRWGIALGLTHPDHSSIWDHGKWWNRAASAPQAKGAAWQQPDATDWTNRPRSFLEELAGPEVPK